MAIDLKADIERVLISRERIGARLDELAGQIAADLTSESRADGLTSAAASGEASGGASGGGEVTLVPILTGSIILVADLIRRLPLPIQIHLISVTSYPGKATTSQGPTIDATLTQLPDSLAGRHVLLIDDILDSGRTLHAVRSLIEQRNPKSVRTCVLLHKQVPMAVEYRADYVGFEIPDEFVVGYGLDYDDYYRNLPDICTLKREVVA